MRHYYALSDSFTGPNPTEYTSGFTNCGEVIAFSSVSKRTAWLAATKLLKARAITRPQAIKRTPALKADEWTPVFPTLVGVFLSWSVIRSYSEQSSPRSWGCFQGHG